MTKAPQIRVDSRVQPAKYNGWEEPGCVVALLVTGVVDVYWPATGLRSWERVRDLRLVDRAPAEQLGIETFAGV